MQISEHKGANYITLVPVGDLDANSSMQMDEKIQNGIDQEIFQFHIACEGLRYISSAGLGVFISFLESLTAHGGRFVFSGMAENVYKVFQLLGLEQLMTIVATREDAEKLLQA